MYSYSLTYNTYHKSLRVALGNCKGCLNETHAAIIPGKGAQAVPRT
jgi:hypothetical protein